MTKNVDARPRRDRRRFFKIIVVGAVGSLGLMWCFAMQKDKFSRPSESSRDARRRGVFLHELELTAFERAKDERVKPKEAWTETVYENYESFSIMRKGVAGLRVCVRLEYPAGKNVDDDPLWDGLYITLNGKPPEARGGVWNSTGVTLDFASFSNDDIPKEGEVAICGKGGKVISNFRYLVR